jgi:hypothetical protein
MTEENQGTTGPASAENRPAPKKFRCYIDEVGNADLKASHDPNHRFLSLTGLIFEIDYVANVVQPAVEGLKRKYFGSHPDDPIIFHRAELVSAHHPFKALKDPVVSAAFNAELLALLESLDYRVITAVIDKAQYLERYRTWQRPPYHYCLTVIVERYVSWLSRNGYVGDVMVEARCNTDDQRLRDCYAYLYEKGSDYMPSARAQMYLTSKELKVRNKIANIAGLQLADLIAHPSFRATQQRMQGLELPANFGGEIAKILERSKYHRRADGYINGWGRKWLP